MMRKKQTIWLMTMLSLIAVLSIYYLTSPETEMATKPNEPALQEVDADEASADTQEAADPVFSEMRLQLNDTRSKMKEDLQEVVATTTISEEERSDAYSKMQEISDVSSTENMLETLIKAEGYSDALVRIEDGNIRVTIKSDKDSPAAANKVVRLVTKELGHYEPIAVEFQPPKK